MKGNFAGREIAFALPYHSAKLTHPFCTFTHRIIDAYTRGAPDANLKDSLMLFELMEAQRRVGAVTPNERVYTTFIRAMTKGLATGLHKKASILLARMEQLYAEGNEGIKPTIFAYNAVLNACAQSIHVDSAPLGEAFKTAVKIFTELRNSDQSPDHVTYGNMLRCSRLLPEGEQKDKFMCATFRLCCEQGFVNAFVIRDLQESATEELQQSLLGVQSQKVDMDALPREWSRMLDNDRGRGGSRERGGRPNRRDRGGSSDRRGGPQNRSRGYRER
jgi:hypothetical protein